MTMMLTVEVAYALPTQQWLVKVQLPYPATVTDALNASGLLPPLKLELAELSVGVFGQHCDLQTTLTEGDRVEIYRPLQQDPKEARRQRAAK